MDLALKSFRIRSDGFARDEVVSDPQRSDAALLRAASEGSEAALEVLFRRHWRRARHTAYLVCLDAAAAEDIAQEAFVSAVAALPRFDRRRPFEPWLHRIVVNRAIDWTRKRAARREVVAPARPDVEADPDPGFSLDRELLRALAELPADHRAVVAMRYLLDLTPGEIARALSIPRGTVNSRLRRGLDRLSHELDPERA